MVSYAAPGARFPVHTAQSDQLDNSRAMSHLPGHHLAASGPTFSFRLT
jgi:hypothetical protein